MNRLTTPPGRVSSLCAVVGLTLLANGCGSAKETRTTRPEPPPFNPTVAVRCRMTPESERQDLAAPLHSAIKAVIATRQRVTVADDPEKARLLLDVSFFLKNGPTNTNDRMTHRFQIVDSEHDVVVFEDTFIYPIAPDSDAEAIMIVRDEFEKLAKYLEKSLNASSQVELGANGVVYLEGVYRKDAQINYFRADHNLAPQRVYLDYSIKMLGADHASDAMAVASGSVYDVIEKQHLEVAPTAEKANFRIRIGGAAGVAKSYSFVFDGEAAPATSASAAALQATIQVFRAGENEPILELHASGDAPPDKIYNKKPPQEISAANLRAALGKKLAQLADELSK